MYYTFKWDLYRPYYFNDSLEHDQMGSNKEFRFETLDKAVGYTRLPMFDDCRSTLQFYKVTTEKVTP